jgi:hypothetical protein
MRRMRVFRGWGIEGGGGSWLIFQARICLHDIAMDLGVKDSWGAYGLSKLSVGVVVVRWWLLRFLSCLEHTRPNQTLLLVHPKFSHEYGEKSRADSSRT